MPEGGFGRLADAVYEWLDLVIGKRNYAWHSGGSGSGSDRIALYFRDPTAVLTLCNAFPDLVLVDGSTSPHYHSPNMRPGQQEEDQAVCNLYSMTRTVDALRRLFDERPRRDRAGNLEPGNVYPDRLGAIIRHDGAGELELTRARRGFDRSRNGFTTKIHLRVNGVGLPMRSDITPGQTLDYLGLDLVMYDNLPELSVLLAGRGYDSDDVRKSMDARNVVPVIPMGKSRKIRVAVDRKLYWLRNLVERCFNKL